MVHEMTKHATQNTRHTHTDNTHTHHNCITIVVHKAYYGPHLREARQVLHALVLYARQPQAQRAQRQVHQRREAAVADALAAVEVEAGERGVGLRGGAGGAGGGWRPGALGTFSPPMVTPGTTGRET